MLISPNKIQESATTHKASDFLISFKLSKVFERGVKIKLKTILIKAGVTNGAIESKSP